MVLTKKCEKNGWMCVVRITEFKFGKVLNRLNDYSSKLILKNDVWWNKVHVMVEWGRMNLEKRQKMKNDD